MIISLRFIFIARNFTTLNIYETKNKRALVSASALFGDFEIPY